ncbi:MAG: tetratricopeptide repeat protein, partial [Nannocystaceae bacterium]
GPVLAWVAHGNPAVSAPEKSASASSSSTDEPVADPSNAPVQTPDEAADDGAGEETPNPANAESIEQARAFFLRARKHFYADEFSQAGEFFLKSFAAHPSLEALFGAANSFDRNGEILLALDLYERYFTYVDNHPTRPAAAQRSYQSLVRRVARVDIKIKKNASFKELRVNGKLITKKEFPVRILPGVVQVEFIGEQAWQREQLDTSVTAGGTAVFRFNGFTRPDVGPAIPQPIPDTRSRARGDGRLARSLFWAGAGMTAASGVVMGAFGGLTMREKSQFEAAACHGMCTGPTEYPEDHENRFHRYREVTNVMIGVTAGFAVFTVVTGVIALSTKRRQAEQPTQPQLSLDATGFTLQF